MAEKKNRKRRSLGRKTTGGKYKKSGKKKKYQLGHQARIVKLKETKAKILKVRGGNEKLVLLTSNIINLIDKNKKSKKVKILNVLETPSNRFLARQNILTKGAIVQTESGKARITNRPGQEGSIQGILIE
ncbi:30S ribosomal protein S8e [Candidatus Pacearchaeota archaeon]|nr:30S ribosomal protein S8e [Candidatus Pacearchaeota archaeon]